jgi:hypothetical protein
MTIKKSFRQKKVDGDFRVDGDLFSLKRFLKIHLIIMKWGPKRFLKLIKFYCFDGIYFDPC